MRGVQYTSHRETAGRLRRIHLAAGTLRARSWVVRGMVSTPQPFGSIQHGVPKRPLHTGNLGCDQL